MRIALLLCFVASATLAQVKPPAGGSTSTADATTEGTVSTSAQTLAGQKTFSSGVKTNTVDAATATSVTVTGAVADGASAVGVIVDNGITLANSSARLLSVRNHGSEKIYIDYYGDIVLTAGFLWTKDASGLYVDAAGTKHFYYDGTRMAANGSFKVYGTVSSTTEATSFVAAPNALLTAVTLGGTVTGPQAFTVTGVTLYVATQALSTAANTVFTLSDGTNTCTATFTCNGSGIASLQGAGAKRVTTADGAGTGCAYAASTALTIAVTAQGCATAAVVNNINVIGQWQ